VKWFGEPLVPGALVQAASGRCPNDHRHGVPSPRDALASEQYPENKALLWNLNSEANRSFVANIFAPVDCDSTTISFALFVITNVLNKRDSGAGACFTAALGGYFWSLP
jgi:hypothetical protein